MLDHVTIRVDDLAASARFYGQALALLGFPSERVDGGGFHEWDQWSIAQAGAARPPTRGLHVGFVARDRAQVDAWWRALTAEGYRSDGEPGPRPEYGEAYYGAFVLDPDGNSVEAVHNPPLRDRVAAIDHLWIRVENISAAHRFYEAIAPVVGFEVRPLPDRRVHFRGEHASFSVVEDDPTENVHLAFHAPDSAAVDAFHRAAVEAGYRDNGAPRERPEYHAGYYAAFVLDPDGNNVESVFHDR